MLRASELRVPLVVGALVAVMVWGTGHALTPGHGKTIVAAYLIGSRSTPWHALYLGLTATLTHTLRCGEPKKAAGRAAQALGRSGGSFFTTLLAGCLDEQTSVSFEPTSGARHDAPVFETVFEPCATMP